MTDDFDAPEGERLEGKRDRLARLLSRAPRAPRPRRGRRHPQGDRPPHGDVAAHRLPRPERARRTRCRSPSGARAASGACSPGRSCRAMRLTLPGGDGGVPRGAPDDALHGPLRPDARVGVQQARGGAARRAPPATSSGRSTRWPSAGLDEAFNRHVEDLTRAWAERRVVALPVRAGRATTASASREWREVRPYLLEPSLADPRALPHRLRRGPRGAAHVQGGADPGPLADAADASRRRRGGRWSTSLRPAWDIIADQPADGGGAALRAGGRRAGGRGDVAPDRRSSTEAPGRLARVARDGGRHRRDPALDPVLGRGRGGARAGRPARGRGRQPRPCRRTVRAAECADR